MTESGKRKKRKHSSPEPSTSASASASAKKSRTSSDGSDDRLSMPTEIKTALTSDRKFPADFLEKVTKLNKDLRENVYRAISLGTEKGNAPFAAEGGQKRLREIYDSVAT